MWSGLPRRASPCSARIPKVARNLAKIKWTVLFWNSTTTILPLLTLWPVRKRAKALLEHWQPGPTTRRWTRVAPLSSEQIFMSAVNSSLPMHIPVVLRQRWMRPSPTRSITTTTGRLSSVLRLWRPPTRSPTLPIISRAKTITKRHVKFLLAFSFIKIHCYFVYRCEMTGSMWRLWSTGCSWLCFFRWLSLARLLFCSMRRTFFSLWISRKYWASWSRPTSSSPHLNFHYFR